MGKNILICDDAAFIRMMMKDTLSKGGHTVVGEAANGKDFIIKPFHADRLLEVVG